MMRLAINRYKSDLLNVTPIMMASLPAMRPTVVCPGSMIISAELISKIKALSLSLKLKNWPIGSKLTKLRSLLYGSIDWGME